MKKNVLVIVVICAVSMTLGCGTEERSGGRLAEGESLKIDIFEETPVALDIEKVVALGSVEDVALGGMERMQYSSQLDRFVVLDMVFTHLPSTNIILHLMSWSMKVFSPNKRPKPLHN